jgi:hypothetical protein
MREENTRASVTTASTCVGGPPGRSLVSAAAVQRGIGDAADGEHARRDRAYDHMFFGQRHKAFDSATTLHQRAEAAILAAFVRLGPHTRLKRYPVCGPPTRFAKNR